MTPGVDPQAIMRRMLLDSYNKYRQGPGTDMTSYAAGMGAGMQGAQDALTPLVKAKLKQANLTREAMVRAGQPPERVTAAYNAVIADLRGQLQAGGMDPGQVAQLFESITKTQWQFGDEATGGYTNAAMGQPQPFVGPPAPAPDISDIGFRGNLGLPQSRPQDFYSPPPAPPSFPNPQNQAAGWGSMPNPFTPPR